MMEAKKNIIQFVVEEKVSNEENSEYEIDWLMFCSKNLDESSEFLCIDQIDLFVNE
jgi:hypothetical protein